ncbi:MAG TPA: CocE/NonD family hydrolase, partial [Planctomycetota bacterium]|nr:CocE/NonD family hydrolase [Planctomycetota bacterium]
HPRPRPAVPVPQPPQALREGYSYFLEMGPLSHANDERHFRGDVAFWTEMMHHPNYDDYWKARNIRPHLKDIRPAVLTVGGWFDAEDLFGALKVHEAVQTQSPGASPTLVMGPWYHGQWAGADGESLGHVRFGSKTSLFYREHIEFPFFMQHLKGVEDAKLPRAYMFETGSNRWRSFAQWPPANLKPRTFFFRAAGRLSSEPPSEETGFDEYESDPAKPVPYIAGQATGMTREHMVDDQRFAASRPDVLVYQTETLAEDLTIAGAIVPSLQVSTTGTDSDWVVKVIDVYPDDERDPEPNPSGTRMAGYQQLLRGECFRGRFRRSFEAPEAFTPGKVEKVEYVMPDVLHTFRRGHRVMVQVQSSWFPLVDRNPQTYVDIYGAQEGDFRKATERVYRSKDTPSGVKVFVLGE